MCTFDSSRGESSSQGNTNGYSISRGYSVSEGFSTQGGSMGYSECASHTEVHYAADSLHLHDGFVVNRGGLTYIGPVEDFPERYVRQALCGLEQSKGTAGLIAFLEDYVAVLKLKRRKK